MAFLNRLFKMFDNRIDRFDVYKVEAVETVYMCASGLPHKNGMLTLIAQFVTQLRFPEERFVLCGVTRKFLSHIMRPYSRVIYNDP